MAQSEAPDLILMEMSLPVLDGYGATKELKAASSIRLITVMALTGNAMTGNREKAMEAGCTTMKLSPLNSPG